VSFPTVGVVGAGQLARMMVPPAVALGVTLRVLADSAGDSAAQVVGDVAVGDYRDLQTLLEFAAGCDVLTFDHEHVPREHLLALRAAGVVAHPSHEALVHAQDKGMMRERLQQMGVAVPAWRRVSSPREVVEFVHDEHPFPVVLKATRGGYDGKGVWAVSDVDEAAWVLAHDTVPGFLVEERVAFSRELAALVARSPSGQAVAYPVVETVQVDGICREVYAPAPGLSDEHAVAAQRIALDVAGRLGVVGVLAVELFDTPDAVVVNELAMRPHNSGHWTIDGAVTSQFENHLRAVLDLPLGEPTARDRHTVMVNVLGGDLPDLYPAYRHVLARDPGLHVHAYGKEIRPGRKVGHVTVGGDDLESLRVRGRHAAAYLRGDIDE
jgi:5-(carboxyamino)imidazole ribonucleotide synthase